MDNKLTITKKIDQYNEKVHLVRWRCPGSMDTASNLFNVCLFLVTPKAVLVVVLQTENDTVFSGNR